MSSNKKPFDGAETADEERHGKTYVKKGGYLIGNKTSKKMMIFLTKLNLKMP